MFGLLELVILITYLYGGIGRFFLWISITSSLFMLLFYVLSIFQRKNNLLLRSSYLSISKIKKDQVIIFKILPTHYLLAS